jgi:aryl carrier-like protein
MDPEQIGRDHGFLQLGGDSIAAMRLIVLARQEGLVMTVQDVFKQTRLRDLAGVAQARDAAIENNTHRVASPGKEGGPMIELDDAALHILREADVPTSMVQLATSYQSMCVQGALQTPRQWWVYCYFDLPRGAEIARAHRSCQALWEKMDILRTAFFFSGSRVLQAVVPPLDAPVTIQRVRGDVEKHFEQVCRLDLQQPAVLGKPFTKFFLIQAAQGPLRLAIRLSHAQYDAVTLGLIARSISASLCRHDPPRFAQFTDFVEHTCLNRDAGIAYWQSLLSGAEMSRINSASCATRDTGSLGEEITIKRIVSLPALRHEITAATTFTAICARALAKVTRKSDLLFARLVSGRAGLGADLQNAAGACLNYVPVRIRIDPATSLGEAERTLQQQFIDTLPYEGVDISWTSSGGPAPVWKSGEWGLFDSL